jgi:hypothetical protein
MSRNKYGAKKVTLYGIKFDSIAESERYLVLKDMQERGEISLLVVHPKYRLLKSFTNPDGKKVRGVTYTADFRYFDDKGYTVVEDVKGGRATQTAAFVIKSKWFQHLNPFVHFRVVEVK